MHPINIGECEWASRNHFIRSWRLRFRNATFLEMGEASPASTREGSGWLRQAAANIGPKTTVILLSALPQFEGSPLVQSLLLSLMLFSSGNAMTYMRFWLAELSCLAFPALREPTNFAPQ
jgi:hypothetical protein